MECPYCGAELTCDDYYGTGRQEHYYGTAANSIYYPSTYEKLGDIYSCPNSNGFENEDEAQVYKDANEELKDTPIDEVCCDSGCFNGNFYTDKSGELHEGYPC